MPDATITLTEAEVEFLELLLEDGRQQTEQYHKKHPPTHQEDIAGHWGVIDRYNAILAKLRGASEGCKYCNGLDGEHTLRNCQGKDPEPLHDQDRRDVRDTFGGETDTELDKLEAAPIHPDTWRPRPQYVTEYGADGGREVIL